jgi:hypothetical protein
MDLKTLSNKVQLSRLLTESERQYWVGNLPHMSEEQLLKLEAILQEAQELSWSTEMQTYMSIANKATAALAA